MAFEIENGVLRKYIEEDGITEVAIPEGVTVIGFEAFYECRSLHSVTIPESVMVIGKWSFYRCTNLKSIRIPDGVTNIRDCAFYKCASLQIVHIPEGVTSIGDHAFDGCLRLQYVWIPETVTEIGGYAFCNCTSLINVKIPEGVTIIGRGAFAKTPWLEQKPDEMVIINNILLTYKGMDAHVTIPEGVRSIAECAFYERVSLTNVTIPESVKNIEDYAFNGCTSLRSVRIPESVTIIEDHAFNECTSLRSVHIPEGVTRIGDYAFGGCKSLSDVVIPESVTEIGSGAFNGCRSIRLFGIAFTPDGCRKEDYDKAVEMLKSRNFSTKLNTQMKCAVLLGYWLKTGDRSVDVFIRRGLTLLMMFLIENNNIEVIGKLLESGKFIIENNIDKFIRFAITNTQNGGNIEIQTMLLHYKSEVLGYGDPADIFKL